MKANINLGIKPVGFKGGQGLGGNEPKRIVGEKKRGSYQPSPLRGVNGVGIREERKRSNSILSNGGLNNPIDAISSGSSTPGGY
jgi:hypothetical protein